MSEKDKDTEPSASETKQKEESSDKIVARVKRIDAVGILWTFGKCLTALLPVYLAGYYRVSSSLVVFGLALYSGWKHTRSAKEARLKSAMQLFSQDSGIEDKNNRDVPAWVRNFLVQKLKTLQLNHNRTSY